MPVRACHRGEMANILHYERANGRCPSREFFDGLDQRTAKKFKGSFDALTKQGASYQNQQRFTPLHKLGKPLWEFKEFDHRFYCYRSITGNFVHIILFNGWIKEKVGKTQKEDREIERATNLYKDFLNEYPGGKL